jgi:hypothetical protein
MAQLNQSDIFPAETTTLSLIFVLLHGGYWRLLDVTILASWPNALPRRARVWWR